MVRVSLPVRGIQIEIAHLAKGIPVPYYRLPHLRSTLRRGAKPWEGHQAWHELAVACTMAYRANRERRTRLLLFVFDAHSADLHACNRQLTHLCCFPPLTGE